MKNKVLSILAIFITFITLSCKTDLIEKETTPQGKGLISIKIGNNAKMLSPNTDKIDISSINWTVTFTNKQDTTKQLQRSTSNGILKEYLPFGTYIIEIEGITQSAEDGSTAIAFYGKTEAAISPEEKTTTANIYVAPKKSENRTGSFEYSITLKDRFDLAENLFSAKLSSVNNNSDPIVINEEKEIDAANKTCTVTFSQAEIPSGYYTLTISCATIPTDNDPISITQILQKNILVEICDNAKTSDSIELQVEDYKTLYAVTPESDDGNKYANYSGEFKQYPADFLNILNDDTITNATINMLPNNIPIIEPAKIKDKFFDIYLYNESDPGTTELYGYTYKDYNETKLDLAPNKSLMLLGNDNYEESILNLYIYAGDTSEPTTTVTLLNGSPSIYLSSSSSSSSKFKFNINKTSNYHDKPFMQCDVSQDSDEYLLKILDDNNTKISSFDGITLNGNDDTDKVVYTSTSKTIDGNTCNNIQYFILPNHKGSMPDTIIISADKTELYIDEKVTFTIQGEFTAGTQFKWYANRKLVQNGPNKSYTHTAKFTTDEVLCFIYQDENNYITVDAKDTITITTDPTPIALYSAVSTFKYYYLYNLTLADVKNISKGISSINNFNDINNDTSYYDNCYDNAGTLWWITDSGIYNSNNSETAVITDLSNWRYIDFDTDTLYATRMDATGIIYKITDTNGTYSPEQLFDTEAQITCITFHNDYCYTIEEVRDDTGGNTITYTLKKYPLQSNTSTTGTTSKVQTALLTKTTTVDDNWNETITFSSLIFDNDNQIANTLKNPLFSDIQVTDEGIFVLFNDCYYNKDYDAHTVDANSRGGIIKFDNDLQLNTDFGPNGNGIFGWKNEKHTSSGTNDNITYAITSYMPDFQADTQLSSKYFYSPRKFLAIKPKKLIFADDGFMFYGNNDDPSGKDVNQVIEFDIKSAMFDSYNLGQSIDFNKRATPGSVAAGSFSWYD